MSTVSFTSQFADTARDRKATTPADPIFATSTPVPELRHDISAFLARVGFGPSDSAFFISIYLLVLVLFGVLYFVTRSAHSEAWQWGRQLINVPLATIGLVALLISAASALVATWAACRQKRGLTMIALILAMVGCLGFVGTILVELDAKAAYGISPGDQFHPSERYSARRFGVKLPKKLHDSDASEALAAAAIKLRTVDATYGRKLFLGTCASCHGPGGHGLPGQGKDLNSNEFIKDKNDQQLLEFVKVGRAPWDKLNTTKVQMPPRGGNPMLSDDDLRDVVSFVMTLQKSPANDATVSQGEPPSGTSGQSVVATAQPQLDLETMMLTHRFVVSAPALGPAGLASAAADWVRPRWKAPRDGVTFADSFFALTGFMALLAGLIAIVQAAALVNVWRRRQVFSLRAPIAVGAGACLSVATYWLALFPFVFLF